MRAGVGRKPKTMEDPTAARGGRAQGADGGHSASWDNPRGRGRAGGRLKSEIKVTIGGNRPPRLGGHVVSFGDVREFFVAYSEYEQQMHITNQDGRDRALARRRELVDSATQMMVADELYDVKPWVDLSEMSYCKGSKVLLASIYSRRMRGILPPDIPCAENGCERAGR